MKAELKRLYSLEIEDIIDKFYPDDEYFFGTWMRAYIGPSGEESSEAFDIFVCSSDWIKKSVKTMEWYGGRIN